jgi:hypothetical protein
MGNIINLGLINWKQHFSFPEEQSFGYEGIEL